ncbi:MAG TPA: hypothetical protein VJ999_03000 [Candidatus Sulfotelmatobacter sp.]|nr:hypothetical protein [Candidatus Sulfotelmatobacter sp.]
MMFKTSTILLALIVAFGISASAGYSQEVKSRRDAFGADRADEVEALLHALFPDAKVQWDPVLAIRRGSAAPEPVDLGDFTATREADGHFQGVAMLEVGSAKTDHIEKLKKFQLSDVGKFETAIVAFRTTPSGRRLETKKLPLDPNDPLTRLSWFEVRNWPSGGWPLLRLRYASYTPSGGTLAILEWDSLFNMETGSFAGRIPTGVSVLRNGGEETLEVFSVNRTSATQIAIYDNGTGKTIDYPCSDPCVVDGRTFLGQLFGQR